MLVPSLNPSLLPLTTPSLLHHLNHLNHDLTLLGEEGGDLHLHSLHLALLSPSLAPILADQAGLTIAMTLPTSPATLAILNKVVLGEAVTMEEQGEVREVMDLLGIHSSGVELNHEPNKNTKLEARTNTFAPSIKMEACAPYHDVTASFDGFGMEQIYIISNSLNGLIKRR